ncbi:MAG: PDZ domain-containing protein [Pirellulales bacterium]|nr:PDZ domain-containing protein [Pirellulales bacterium]
MPRRNLLLLLLAVVGAWVCFARSEHDPYTRNLASGIASIRRNALEPVGGRALFDGAMDGMVKVLRNEGDEHAQFFDESEANSLRNKIHQQYGGIGVRIMWQGTPPRPVLAGPIAADTPAGKVGLQTGDRILAVDDHSTAEATQRELVAWIMGDPGTSVRLTVQRGEVAPPQTFTLVREVIGIDSILGHQRNAQGAWTFSLAENSQIAHVRMVSFGDRTAREFADLVARLTGDGVRAIVLDLRENEGGSLDTAVAVCQQLLPAHSLIVETRGRGDVVLRRYETTSDGMHCTMSLVVLVNRNSASAAEIVAACLQDHHRAAVVGERSYGKGTVQQLLPLGKSLLKLTWARFRRPSGINIHRFAGAGAEDSWGVLPDKGCDLPLTDQEHEAFLRHRDWLDEGDSAKAEPGFVDSTFNKAVQVLSSQMENETSPPVR